MTPTDLTPVASLLGGALIGASAVALMATVGRIAGISGILSALLPPGGDNRAGRLAFVIGLLAAPLLMRAITGHALIGGSDLEPGSLAVAGVLVGFGAVWGGGCTSGHGVCGLARLSKRSSVATAVFMATAIVTVYAINRL